MAMPLQVSFSVANGVGAFGPFQSKGGSHDGFGEVSVRRPVCPLALALEAADHSVATERFFMPAHLVQTRIAV